MSEEIIRETVQKEILNGIKKELDSTLIFTYIQSIEQENQQLKEVLDEIRKYIESKNNGVCIINGEEKPAYTFLLDFDKAREFVWELLQILDKAKNNDS